MHHAAVVLQSYLGSLRGLTTEDGEVVFTALRPGRWELFCPSSGGREEITVLPGAEVTREFRLPGEKASVHVVDLQGAPIGGAEVYVSSWVSDRGALVGSTDSQGAAVVQPLSSLRFVEARAAGFVPSGRVEISHERRRAEIVLRPGGAALHGRVLARDGGAGIGGAQVTLWPPMTWSLVDGRLLPGPSPIEVRAQEDGRFTLRAAPLGLARMSVAAEGFAVWEGTASVTDPPGPATVVLLEPEVPLEGLLLDAGHRPVGDTRIVATTPDGAERRARTNANGEFTFAGLGPGVHTVEASVRALGRGVTHVRLPTEARLIVTLEDRWTIAGRVLDSGGHAVEDARVGIWRGAPGGTAELFHGWRTDARGEFRLVVEDEHASVALAVLYPEDALFPRTLVTVAQGTLDVEVVLAETDLAAAFLAARSSSGLVVEHLPTGNVFLTGAEAREIEIGPLPPALYRVSLAPEYPALQFVGEYLLTAGAVLDLGVLD